MGKNLSDLITSDPETLSGSAVFEGTRVPVSTLFDWLRNGHSIEEILENFPSVSREAAIAVLDASRDVAIRSARKIS